MQTVARLRLEKNVPLNNGTILDRVSTYCQPTVIVFLYGNTDLTDVENADLFSAVQDYILKTKRFCLKTKVHIESSYNSCTHN